MSTRPWKPEHAAGASQRPHGPSLLERQLEHLGASRDTPPTFEQWQALLAWVDGSFLGTAAPRAPAIDEPHDPYAALRASEERHRILFDASPLPIWVFDPTTLRFRGCNDAFVRLLGYSRDELLGMCLLDLEPPRSSPALAEGTLSTPIAAISEGPAIGVAHFATRDGTVVDLEITVHTTQLDGEPAVLALGVEVTHSRLVEDQLRHAQRMEAIGRLTGGVAHDFNNILAAILGYGELARLELGDDHAVSADLREIEAAAHRAAGLARQLLMISRR